MAFILCFLLLVCNKIQGGMMEAILHFIKHGGWLIIATALFFIGFALIIWKGIKSANDMPVYFSDFKADEMFFQKELDKKYPDENGPEKKIEFKDSSDMDEIDITYQNMPGF
jgi:hypothetical protein